MPETVVTVTGNNFARVSNLNGLNIRYRGVIEETVTGVRMTKRELPRARQAGEYRDRFLLRLQAMRMAKEKQ